jgi:hypothetical protein
MADEREFDPDSSMRRSEIFMDILFESKKRPKEEFFHKSVI